MARIFFFGNLGNEGCEYASRFIRCPDKNELITSLCVEIKSRAIISSVRSKHSFNRKNREAVPQFSLEVCTGSSVRKSYES